MKANIDPFSEKMNHLKTKKELKNQKKANKPNICKNKSNSPKKNKLYNADYSNSSSRVQSPVYSPFQGKSYRISDSIPPNTNLFVNNIKKNINVHPNKRKWDKKILAICTLLFLLSFTGYIFLRKNILLPSVSSIYRYLNTDFDLIDSENIISIEKLSSIR